MPDLNLIDEEEFEEQSTPVAPTPKKKTSGSAGGGGVKTILIVLILLIVGAAGVYFLNQRGIIKLWGKKSQPLSQMQEEPFPFEQVEQPVTPIDTTEVALLEAPPIEEKVEATKEPETKTTNQPSKKSGTTAETEMGTKLSEMQGEFTVQVIAYREKKKALETASNLEFAGYPSFVERIPMKGGDWYTVRIGRYPSRDDAKKAVKTFAAQLRSQYVIDKIREK